MLIGLRVHDYGYAYPHDNKPMSYEVCNFILEKNTKLLMIKFGNLEFEAPNYVVDIKNVGY